MEGPDYMGHGLGCGQGFKIHTLEVQADLGVGETGLKLFGKLQRQGGLADATHSSQTEDGSGASLGQLGAQEFQILLATGEVGGWGGELVEGNEDGPLCNIGRIGGSGLRRSVPDDRQNLFGDLGQLSIATIAFESCQRSPIERTNLEPGEPWELIPDAGLYDYREEGHPLLLPAVQEMWNLLV